MSINSFDLKIDNYTITELEKIFELPNMYDEKMVEEKTKIITMNILNDISILPDMKDNLILFMNMAKKKMSSYVQTIYNMNTQLKPSATIEEGGRNNSIIEKPKTPYIFATPSDYFQGTINPIKKRIIKQQLNIDSRFRDNYKITRSTDLHFDLPNRFSNIVSMELATFQFSHSYYSISSFFGNNFFTIRKYVTGTKKKISTTIIIPDGNYAGSDLFAYINTKLKNDPNFELIDFASDVTTTGSSGSGRTIVNIFKLSKDDAPPYLTTNSNGITVPKNYTAKVFDSFILDFQSDINGNLDYANSLQKKFGWILGFRYGLYGSKEMIADFYGKNVNTFNESFSFGNSKIDTENEYIDDVIVKYNDPQNKICKSQFTSKNCFINYNTFSDATFFISEGLLDISGSKYFYLIVNDYNNNVVNNGISSVFQNAVSNNNILAKINVTQPFFTTAYQTTLQIITQPREYFGPVYIQKMNIQLTNEYGDLLDLNNMDFSLVLIFNTLYDI